MITKRTAIGIGVGGAIIAIGLYALMSSFGLQTIDVDETFGPGEFTSYRLNAPNHALQQMKITGERFELELQSPQNDKGIKGLQIPLTEYKNELALDWTHLLDGQSIIEIKNTGQTDIHITGTFNVSTDPILFTYHIIVITAGVVIVGFSAGFSVRKPRGF